MGCTKSKPKPLHLDPVYAHELKIEINKGFKMDYFAKKATKPILKLSQDKHLYDKQSQIGIEKLITLLLKKRERLDADEERKENKKKPQRFTY